MTDTVYRFLPWSRRGLAASLPAAVDGAAVPARADVRIEVVIAGAGPVPTSTTLHGPGDVIGLDPTVIVRTLPRPSSTNVEPNYLAAVDFDQPELPWLFTPTGVPASGHLRPWLVLVVVRERDGVAITVPAGARLPVLSIDDKADEELPDLADSWAWAHVQLLDADAGTTGDAVGRALADHPNRNVSRLVCPRRLKENERWIACLVPAYDAGVQRGFGSTPAATDLQPAWTDETSISLPVYFHWRFQTGPQGDFESLARRLKPHEVGAGIGRIKMHVGEAADLVDLPPDDPGRFLDMDGALQAPEAARLSAQPKVEVARLADVPDALADGLAVVTRLLADAADGTVDNQVDPAAGDALGPPVYAGPHARRTWVTDTDPTWFRELNTDPRCRVAAGLGAEVMRRYQEDVMEACWQQVGDVLALEAALSRARLSLEAGLRFTRRHLVPLQVGRFLQLTAPLSERVVLGGATLPAAIRPTSLPDRTTDAAMRRFTASTGRVVSTITRRAADPAAAARVRRAAGEVLVSTLAAGRADVDATRFPMVAIDGLTATLPRADAEGLVDLSPLGVRVVLDRAGARELGRISRELVAVPSVAPVDRLRPRENLLDVGLVTSRHTDVSRRIAATRLADRTDALAAGLRASASDLLEGSPTKVLDAVLEVADRHPGGVGFLVESGDDIKVRTLGIAGREELVVLSDDDTPNVAVARLDTRLRGTTREVAAVIAALPADTLAMPVHRRREVTPAAPVDLIPGAAAGAVAVRHPLGRGDVVSATTGTTVTVPPLVKDAATIGRYREAAAALVDRTALGADPLVPQLVPFALDAAVVAARTRLDPLVVHPSRLDTMVYLGDVRISTLLADPAMLPAWRVPARFDRVMAFPRLDLAAYHYLAEYDRTRFCPGVDEIPPESITLLETNPRFVAGFMGGLNHETNRELMWRGYPTDGRGTPWQRFWRRADNEPDIFEMHTWGRRQGRDTLPFQTVDPAGNLVLLVRGDLLRRYPNTMAVAVRAVASHRGSRPSDDPADLRTSVFAGTFDPDVAFFGFPLVSADLTVGEGWFFGLLEPVTEPRFGFDEVVGRETQAPTSWNDVAWPDLSVAPAGSLSVATLAGLGLAPSPGQADGVAAALFQRPFKLLVHARHLVEGV